MRSAKNSSPLRGLAAGCGLTLLLGIAGCQSPIPSVDPRSPPFRDLPAPQIAELDAGRSAYIDKCSGCHALYRPDRGPAGQWTRWVDAMALRSKITGEERERILRYLHVASQSTLADRRG
jgi:hypothetical protein